MDSSAHNGRLIEEWLPLKETNLSSIIEKGFKQSRARYKGQFRKIFNIPVEALGINTPTISNMHTWFARRPCSTSRVLTLASIVSKTISCETFMKAIGFTQFKDLVRHCQLPILYNTRPDKTLVEKITQSTLNKFPKEITILDPMAGGGSIPLEALRLGFQTVAVEYNPVAYLILRASVEFPAKYTDSGLFEETLKAAKELTDRARDEIGSYYGEEAKRYIFARGVRCPFCDGLIPVQGVEPAITKAPRFKNRFLRITYDKGRKTFSVETTDKAVASGTIAKRGNNIKCPYENCGRWFQLRGLAKGETTAFDRWFFEHAKLMEGIVEGFAPITGDLEEKTLNLHIPLVKQAGNCFQAIWDDETERRKLVDSLHTLSDELLELQSYIPLDGISADNVWASTAVSKGLAKWYMLYNPRQLLVIAKLSKIVAETAEKLASKNGEFGAAVATYLALALDKIIDYNTLATKWQGSTFKTGIGNTLRGESTLDFRKEYCEMGFSPPELSLGWALEPDIAESDSLARTAGGILPVLKFLCDDFRGSNVGRFIWVMPLSFPPF